MKQFYILHMFILFLNSSNVMSQNNDFLNDYFFNQNYISNSKFKLILTKLVFYSKSPKESYKDYESKFGNERFIIPEILDTSSISFWIEDSTSRESRRLRRYDSDCAGCGVYYDKTFKKEYLTKVDVNFLNEKLPIIEIIKNKLFTLYYKNNKEESFLYNIKKSDLSNNYRNVLKIELANENLNENEDDSHDITWKICAIENECYIALDNSQLERLDILIGFNVLEENLIYLSRNKDKYMNDSNFISGDQIVFLFKLIQIE